MSTISSNIQNLFKNAEPLLGIAATDSKLQAFLGSLGHWPLPKFASDEFIIYLENKPLGYCLKLDDAETVKNPIAAGIPKRTPVLVGCFFFTEGADDNQQFPGDLPKGIVWSDPPSAVLAKMGPPKFEFKNKTTGVLSTHRWDCGQWELSAKYRDDGLTLRHLYAGLKIQP